MSTEELPPPPWSSKRPQQRKPLTREAITAAALRIVDAEGLDGLNMRRLAEELGAGPASLYAHVSGKQEVLMLLIDEAAGEMEVPEPDPERWQEQTKDFARQMHAVMAAHRDLAGAALANIPTGPNAMRAIEGLLAVLAAGGVPAQVAAYAADLLPQYVTVNAYEGSLYERRMTDDPGYFDGIRAYFEALPADRFPHITGMTAELMGDEDEQDTRFEFGLDLIVRGLAARAESPD